MSETQKLSQISRKVFAEVNAVRGKWTYEQLQEITNGIEALESQLAKAQDILKEIGQPIIRNVGWDKPQKREVCFSTKLWNRLNKALGSVAVEPRGK